jgi:hypothetical protein
MSASVARFAQQLEVAVVKGSTIANLNNMVKFDVSCIPARFTAISALLYSSFSSQLL